MQSGVEVPTFKSREPSDLFNVPISKGKVNEDDVLVMRDSGFSLAAVAKRHVKPEQYLDEYEEALLMDCTPRCYQARKRLH